MTLGQSAGHWPSAPFELIVLNRPIRRTACSLALAEQALCPAFWRPRGSRCCLMTVRAGRGEIQGADLTASPGAWSWAAGAATGWWKWWERAGGV